jgi:glycosyltransferase involved in cell wall biosynthesis
MTATTLSRDSNAIASPEKSSKNSSVPSEQRPSTAYQLVDVIIRTRNSEEFLKECLEAIHREIPVRKIIVVDSGSTDRTLEIASSFEKVDIYVKPELNLGQATKFGFTKAQTEWVAVIDSDIILRKGWFDEMKVNLHDADAVEGCRIDHYRIEVPVECDRLRYGVFGQTLLKREPVTKMDLDLPHGEDAAIKFNFEKNGLRWKKIRNYSADHYPKIQSTTYRRTGAVFRPYAIHVPKRQQIEEGHIYRQYEMITKKQAIARLLIPPIRDAVRAFRARFWFCLAYFRIV